MSVWTIVVAAGEGTRFGGAKQYEPLAGRRVLDHSLDAARTVSDGVVLVVAAAVCDRPEPGVDRVVEGGATRSASVRAGLAVTPESAQIVLVHDAARPLAGAALFRAVVDAIRAGADGAVPVVPVIDTLVHHDGSTVDRDALVAVQTPQAFDAAKLRAAYASGDDATDDASLVRAAGGMVVHVTGHAANFKITTPADLVVAAALVAQ